jgi:hypothetical protein
VTLTIAKKALPKADRAALDVAVLFVTLADPYSTVRAERTETPTFQLSLSSPQSLRSPISPLIASPAPSSFRARLEAPLGQKRRAERIGPDARWLFGWVLPLSKARRPLSADDVRKQRLPIADFAKNESEALGW